MRVGINATFLGSGAAGIETYLRNLIRALATTDPDAEYILYSRSELPEGDIPSGERIRRVVVPSRPNGRRAPFAYSRVISHGGLDVIHEQTSAPFLFGAPLVVTVHDLYHEHFAQDFAARDLARARLLTHLTLRRATAIITDSEFSKNDIMRFYRIRSTRITVAPLAPDPMFRPIHNARQLAAVRRRYETGDQFILFVGALKPNKNVGTVIRAFARLCQLHAAPTRLIVAGGITAWLEEDLVELARATGYADRIVFANRVPNEDLVLLYNAAALFVSPSLFEGFGLPPLEAMACGTPVVTSNTTSVPEVVGDAAIMVDPRDVEALAGAMNSILSDATLRHGLSTRGLQRAATYSWEATARIVSGVYRDVYNSSHRCVTR